MAEIIAEISVNLNEGTFAISGSESFLEKHIESLKNFIKENAKNHVTPKSIATEKQNRESNVQQSLPEIKGQNAIDRYENQGIFYVNKETGEIQILKPVPGKSKAQKSRNVALILLYAKNDTVNSNIIKQHCVEQACCDNSNFAKWFKKKDGCFIRQGNGQNWTLKLSTPGKKEAVELLESMIDVK